MPDFDYNQTRFLGLCMCGRSLKELTFNEMFNPNGHDISGIMMFCGFELIIKSIIAEFNPSLLVERGDINDLNDDFYAINCRKAFLIIKNRFPELNLDLYDELFNDMNNFRNGMLHKGTGKRVSPINFWFFIVEEIVITCLNDSVINYFAEYDPDGLPYIFEAHEDNLIKFDLNRYKGILNEGIVESLTENPYA